MFAVSDKVVCVDDKPRANHPKIPGYPLPVKGIIYVVRDAWDDPFASEGALVQLVGFPEVHSPIYGIRMGFTPSRFRKLEDIKCENRACLHSAI